jgi:hypothetical protein
MSALCGYPLGAKYSCELYDNKLISKDQFERLINIASNSSPLFLVGTVGTIMLHSTKIGYALLISNYLSCVIMGLILPAHEKITLPAREFNYTSKTSSKNFGLILKNSVDNAIQTSLMVGGYITLFSMIIDIIKNNAFYNIVLSSFVSNIISKDTLNGTLLGLIEITKGSYMISSANINIYIKIFIINFFAGFSGLSIISQVSSFLSKYTEINFKKYVYRKLIQGIFSGIIAVIIIQILFSFSIVQPVFAINNYQNNYTIVSLTITFIFIVIVPYVFYYTKKLFHIS